MNLPTIAPTLFVHFKDPATGERLMTTRTYEVDGVTRTEPQRIGVHVYTPGSKVYRTAQNMNATDNIKAGKKELTGAKLDEQQVNLLARTTFKVEGIDLATDFDSLKAFYNDERFVAYREQVAEEQADLGKSSTTSAKA